jgi:hypothetical protein
MGFQGHQGRWGSQIFLQIFEGLLCLLSPLELVLFLEKLEERESPDAKSRDEPTQGSRAPRQLLDIMEALGRLHLGDSRHLPRRETIYSSNFTEGTPNVHLSGFSLILNFLRLSKVSTRSEMSSSSSRVFTTMSSTYASAMRPS